MKLLKTDIDRQYVVDAIQKAREKYTFKLLGYVIMPSHIHVIIHPPENTPIGKIIGSIKNRSARKILARWKISNYQILRYLRRSDGKLALWQKRCFDHNCRSIATIREKILYCHANPVKAGLVKSPADWKWSSHNWYYGQMQGPLMIAEIELF